ncbi:MAG: TraR/DksA C4-type zinc finger protein [Thermoleophilia bacterium]|nr:TraR/DksA C4-type zinc finger protein [Thermoleophilia bacterium]
MTIMPAEVSKKQIEKLVAIREKLKGNLVRLEEDLETAQRELAEEAGNDDRISEIASMAVGRELDMSLEKNVRLLLVRVEEALEAITSGNYGICRSCGKKIPKERLEALPYASQCVECQRRQETR